MGLISNVVSYFYLSFRLRWDATICDLCQYVGRALPHLHVPDTDLSSKVCIVTGASSGIGLELSQQFARRGADVYMVCRNRTKGEKAASNIIDAVPGSDGRVKVLELDTSSLKSVRSFAATWLGLNKQIDVLVHNAGMSDAIGREVTPEGMGTIYATNFLGSFLLTSLLEDSLNENARVICTTSTGQYHGDIDRMFSLPRHRTDAKHWGLFGRPSDSAIYADTKIMQVIFTKLLQQRWDAKCPQRGLTAHCFTPGYTMTEIFDKTTAVSWRADFVYWFVKNATFLATHVSEGTATGVWLATASRNELQLADSVHSLVPQGQAVAQKGGGGFWDRCVRRMTAVDVEEQTVGVGRLERCWQLWECDGGVKWS